MTHVDMYELTMDQTDLKWLRRNSGTYRCFPAWLRTGHGSYAGWIGYRGRYSRWFRKPSFDLWFQEGNGLDGHQTLHLNAAYRDPSMLRGRLAMQVFRDLGVPAPQIWHVWLTMNGKPLGLYQAIEAIDAGWFGRQQIPDGPVYYAVGTEGNFSLHKSEDDLPKRYLATGYEKCHPWDDDFSDLEALVRQINLPDDQRFQSEITGTLDIESFLRWLVGLEFMSHTDGLVQNYALFRPAGGRWQISPWDCDGTWGRTPSGRILAADEMPVGTGDDNRLAIRLLKGWRPQYLKIWQEAQRTVLTREHIIPILGAIYREIRPYVLRDTEMRRSESTFRREPARIRQYISERTAVVRGRLGRFIRTAAAGQ